MAALKPPFTIAAAHQKVKFAQAMWNTCNPAQVSKGYTSDCIWRNRDQFIKGTDEIISFLTKKWEKEKEYRLRKELFAVGGDKEGDMNKIAVQFWYEYRDKYDGMKWKRCYGLEDWTFNVSDPRMRTPRKRIAADAGGMEQEEGKMRKRMMSGNDIILGQDGDGVGDQEKGIEGRWYVDGMDVEDVQISEKHW